MVDQQLQGETPELSSDVSMSKDAPLLTQNDEEYATRGQTRLATPPGYAFRPSDQNLPVITSSGISVTQDQAVAVLAESDVADGRVFQVEKED